MARIEVERREAPAMPTWAWVLFAIAVLLALIALWAALATRPAEVATGPAVTAPGTGVLDLDQVLQDTGLPRYFAYGNLMWQAVEASRFEDRGIIAIGPRVDGRRIYYEQGTPISPYEDLYMQATEGRYQGVYVRYEPVRQ